GCRCKSKESEQASHAAAHEHAPPDAARGHRQGPDRTSSQRRAARGTAAKTLRLPIGGVRTAQFEYLDPLKLPGQSMDPPPADHGAPDGEKVSWMSSRLSNRVRSRRNWCSSALVCSTT